ncbi:MAG: DUF86 domain-containing protein [Thermomicrobiales bacterium]
MLPKSPALLWDIQRAARLVIERTAGVSVSDLESDVWMRAAVERQLEVVGEAARRLSDYDEQTFSKIPHLRGSIRLRNVIAHQYEKIEWAEIKKTIDGPLVEMEISISQLLEEAGNPGEQR